MPRTWLAIWMGLWLTPAAAAQTLEAGARLSALAGAGAAILDDVWGIQNPAAASEARTVSLQASQAFGLEELRTASAVAAFPVRGIHGSVSARMFGYEAYQEATYRLRAAASARQAGGGLFVGMAASHHQLRIRGYGTSRVTTIDVGWIATPLRGFHVGGSAHNVLAAGWSDIDELPRSMRIGAAYLPGDATVALDIIKDIRFPWSGAVGFEYGALGVLLLRAGAATEPSRFTAGVGVDLDAIRADIAVERHYVLGWSPAIEVGFRW